jgi:HD-GYP domain-containing protein (c-di-GMP phosphodiesterase class II)
MSRRPADRDLAEVLGDRIERRGRAAIALHAHAVAVDAKDPLHGAHHMRVASLAAQIAGELGWPWQPRAALHEAALVHDVGKIWIPDEILQEPGPLLPADYDRVKAHATLSASMVAAVLDADQASWIRSHHERWDGQGYPDGLAGEDIPEGARILAVADAWDAMTHTRLYCPRLDAADAADECLAERGRQFWPLAVEALITLLFRPEESRTG